MALNSDLPEPPLDTEFFQPGGRITTNAWQRWFLRLKAFANAWRTQPFLTYTTAPDLTNAQNLGLLKTGFLKLRQTGGVATLFTVQQVPLVPGPRGPKGDDGPMGPPGPQGPSGGGGGGGTTTLTGTQAARPAASTDGDLYLPNDGFSIQRDSGSAWFPWGPIFPLTEPVNGDFAWVNQGGASVVTTNGGIALIVPANSGDSLRIRKKAVPSAPYTVTIGFLIAARNVNFQAAGLVLRNSGSGKLVTFGYEFTSTASNLAVQKWNSPTSFSANYTDVLFLSGFTMLFLQIHDDNTNRICSFSKDGQNFIQLHSVGRTDFITPDEIGFYGGDSSNSSGLVLTALSWVQA